PVASGGFGDIFKAIYQSKPVALKRLRFLQNDTDRNQKLNQKRLEKLCREALLWKNLNHPFVIPFIGLYLDGSLSELYQGDLEILFMGMVSPWMPNGTILKYLETNQSAEVDVLLLEIAQGLRYLHSQSVVHGDLRGDNILVDEEGHARLADFGLASWVGATENSSARSGSPHWMAPELLHPESVQFNEFRRTVPSDVYAFACVCYELYHEKPFSELPASAVLFRVIGGHRPNRSKIPLETWEVIEACWAQEPEKRLRTSEIVEKLEIIRKDKIARLAKGTSATELSGVYQPPCALGMSRIRNNSSTLSLTRPASLIIRMSSPVCHTGALVFRS
ncbi:kinase-like domain-containing protein, partial [Mycena galopus ATCC 62051]